MIDKAIEFLKEGKVVAIPTETVYGLAAPIFNEAAVRNIFTLKGRPSDNPLIAHVSSRSQVDLIAENIPPSFEILADLFWPGPLTLVLPKKAVVPSVVSGGHETIAVRMPSHPMALKIIEGVGSPLVAPSANLSGKPSPTCAQHVLDDFGPLLEVVVDGGASSVGIESTVLSLVGDVPTLLRPGAITLEQLEKALNRKILTAQKGSPTHSPGMKYKHYAPKAKVHIVSEPPSSGYVLSAITPQNYYAALREADLKGVPAIWVVSRSTDCPALRDRVLRSAGLHEF